MSPPARKDAVQGRDDLEALRTALAAVRHRAGISKGAMRIGVTDSGCVLVHGEHAQDFTQLRAKSAEEVLESFEDPDRQDFWEHAIWKGADPDDLRRYFKQVMRGETAEPKKRSLAPAGSRTEGWFKVYNAIVDTGLLGAMPAAAAKAYMVCFRHAGMDGSFYISQQTLAEKIGAKRAEYGKDVMRLLCTAGLVKLVRAGASGRATDYRLVPLNEKTIERAKAAMPSPSRGRNGGVRRAPGCDRPRRVGATDPGHVGVTDPSLQTPHTGASARLERARSRNKKRAPSALSTQRSDR